MPKKATKTTKKTVAKKTTARTAAKKAPVRRGRPATTRTTTAKKTVAKKVVAKKTVAKKVVAVKKPKAIKKLTEKLTKSQIMIMISEQTGLGKKEVVSVFETLETMIGASVKKGALGSFTIPGLMKITTVRKPAKKARKGINPFTGEPTTFKAKAAHTVVKVRALKKLKDMV